MRDIIAGVLLLGSILFFFVGLIGLVKPSLVRMSGRKKSALIGLGGGFLMLIVALIVVPDQPKTSTQAESKPTQQKESPIKPEPVEPTKPIDDDLIRTGASTLNLALVMKYDNSVTCAEPKNIDGSWFTLCHNVDGVVEKRSVWEIKANGNNVIAVAQNGKALSAMESIGATFAPNDGMTHPIILEKGVAPQKVSPDRVFQEFGGY